ncbi:TIGR02444 family protein [Gilvimarinus sp. DA14]|uniref:TIGR02444 family protein n=1 Tax=Gilvimarinus sp. DA14 TaxID=2956798 RepID=UPI0020B816DF|nr:TIGR02444 family protein [Gilvimarinus sp. DA14]UTF58869.1 TIGR02444 family protein [Gilvimarinus sp. DA14]
MSDSLWNFALTVYNRKGVEQICLQLQDEWQVNIPLLLFYLWLDNTGRCLNNNQARQVRELAEHWQKKVITPLRRARRTLKQTPHEGELRQDIKACELQAERQLIEQLQSLAPAPATRARSANQCELYLRSAQVHESALQAWGDLARTDEPTP